VSKHFALTATRIYVVSAVGNFSWMKDSFVCLKCSQNHSSYCSAASISFSPNAAARVYISYNSHFGGHNNRNLKTINSQCSFLIN
jgi:hypothetical protein